MQSASSDAAAREPASSPEPSRRAPSSLVVVGYLAIAAVVAVWVAFDDDPSRYVPMVSRERAGQVATPAAEDLTDERPAPWIEPSPTVTAEPLGSLRGPFNRVAAATALSSAVAQAAACSRWRPGSEESAWVTFAPSGQVSEVRFERGRTVDTPHDRCVVAALRASGVPPFDGRPVTVAVRVPTRRLLQNEPAPPTTPRSDPYPN